MTLGSLLTQDLHSLEDMGLIPDESDEDEMEIVPAEVSASNKQLIGRDFTSIPWFEALVSGSRLGNMRTSKGLHESRDGRVRVEWEITEWTAGDDNGEEMESSESSSTGKRKRGDVEQNDAIASSNTH